MNALLLLIFGHYLADFGFQNDFTAKFKAPGSAPFWVHVMVSHCAMQALSVLLVTNRWELAVAEFACHFVIDCNKCRGNLSFNQDQALHLMCRFAYWGLL